MSDDGWWAEQVDRDPVVAVVAVIWGLAALEEDRWRPNRWPVWMSGGLPPERSKDMETEELTGKERRQQEMLTTMRARLAFYEAHPELIGYTSSILPDPICMPIEDVDLSGVEGYEQRSLIRSKAKVRAQVKALRDAGFTITKEEGYEPTDLVVVAERTFLDHEMRFRIYLSGWCQQVETGEVERVEVVEVPLAVTEAYTRIETKPVTKKLCGSLLSPAELEEL